MAQDMSEQSTEAKLNLQLTRTQTASSLITDHDRENVARIATNLRQRASVKEEPEMDDTSMDPTNPNFNPHEWAKKTIRSFDTEEVNARRRGVLFENLSVFGSGSSVQIQQTVLSTLLLPFSKIATMMQQSRSEKRTILNSFDGLLDGGELLLVLGRPGSGCSTFLKSICGHLNGLDLDPSSDIQYKGIQFARMIKEFRGEVLYNQEVDKHLPHLTVGETLEFAAHARAPQNRINGYSREEYVKIVVQVILAFFGLSHTYSTKVGNDFVRGVSGGERKRVR